MVREMRRAREREVHGEYLDEGDDNVPSESKNEEKNRTTTTRKRRGGYCLEVTASER